MRTSKHINTTIKIVGLMVICIVLVNLSGCDLLGVSIKKRIEYFLDDLNTNRANAITNFHPTETADYGAISGVPSFWDTDFPVDDGTPYTLASVDDSDPLNVRATVNGPLIFGGGSGTDEFKFIMIADGTNWLIEELWYWGVSDIVQ